MFRKAKGWLIFGSIVFVFWEIALMVSRPKQSRIPTSQVTYRPRIICDDTIEKTYDYRNDNITHFDIPLTEGCFGGFVYIPRAWHNYEIQPVGDQSGVWYALWPQGQNPTGVLYPNSVSDVNSGGVMRTQGHGTLRFYSNDVAANPSPSLEKSSETKPSQPFVAKAPPLVHLGIRTADPHICPKPDDAYYEHSYPSGFGHDQVADHDDIHFLFDLKHQDNVVSWANDFRGTIPTCFIIGADGTPADIRFVQEPPDDIAAHLRDYISGWRYQPARYGGPLRVQIAFDFTLR
jgi:hypothetical protein